MNLRFTVVMAWTPDALTDVIVRMNHLGWSEQERYSIKSVHMEAHCALLMNTRQAGAKPLLPNKAY